MVVAQRVTMRPISVNFGGNKQRLSKVEFVGPGNPGNKEIARGLFGIPLSVGVVFSANGTKLRIAGVLPMQVPVIELANAQRIVEGNLGPKGETTIELVYDRESQRLYFSVSTEDYFGLAHEVSFAAESLVWISHKRTDSTTDSAAMRLSDWNAILRQVIQGRQMKSLLISKKRY